MSDDFFKRLANTQCIGKNKSRKKGAYFSSTPISFDFKKDQTEVNNADFSKKKSA